MAALRANMETLHSDLPAIETRLVRVETKWEITPAPTRNRSLKPVAGYEEPGPVPDKRPESRATRIARAFDRAIAAVDLFAGERWHSRLRPGGITPAVATPIFLILIVARFSS